MSSMPTSIPFNRRVTIAALALTLWLASLPGLGQTQPSTDVRELPPNQTLEREMTGAETHRYNFDLQANEFFQVRVEQKGVDVALKLSDASGNVLATMDSPNGKAGFETLSFVAAQSGSFILEVGGFDAKAEKGNYTISRVASRTATAQDKRRVEVERLFVEGIKARDEKKIDVANDKLKKALVEFQELGDDYLTKLAIDGVIGVIAKELENAQVFLMEGQELMTKSRKEADALAAREKLNKSIELSRSVNAKTKDKFLFDRIKILGDAAGQAINVLKILEFRSRMSEALSLDGITQTYTNLGEREQSINSAKQALSVYQEILSEESFKKLSDANTKKHILTCRRFEAILLASIGGDLANYFGKSEEGIEYLKQGLAKFRLLYQETQDAQIKLLEAITLKQIGLIYGSEAKSNDKAIEFLNQSLAIYRSLPNESESVARTLGSIAIRHFSIYDHRAALKNWEEALTIYRENNSKSGQSDVLYQMALTYWLLNNKAKVTEYAEQSLAILQSPDYVENWKQKIDTGGMGAFNELFNDMFENQRLHQIAFNYRLLEDYPKSLEYYQKALVAAQPLKDAQTDRLAIAAVAAAFTELKQWDKAAEFYKKALEISRKVGIREKIAGDLADVGWALVEAEKANEALSYQNEALSIYQSVGVGESKAFSLRFSNLLNDISRSYYALGNKRLAIFYGKRAVNAIQDERQRIQNLDPISQKGFLEKKEKHYRRLSDWLIAEGRIIEAEQVLAMLKEEEILSYLRRDASEIDRLQQRADLRPEERDALKRYNEFADKITTLGAEFGALQELQSKGVKLTVEQEKRYTELSTQIEDASRSFQVFLRQLAEEFARRTNTEKDLQENLALQSDLKSWGEGVVFLYTLAGEDRYRVILITPDTQVDGKTEIKATELNEKIQKFRAAVQDPAVDPRPLGKELYDILIKPVEKQLDGAKAKTLLWSLDGNLRLLPLAALWDGKQYFGQKYQNVTVTLASRTRLGDKVEPNWRALGLGVSEARKVKEPNGTREFSFRPLPAVRAELRSIVQSAQSPNGVMPGQSLLDADFNENALESQLLRGYKVVHIASHFSLNPGDATRSFLLLGDGNVLTVDELRNNPQLKFSGVELLTLSGCETAVVEKDSSGKEIEGFGYVAQQKGAKAILATLWSVADESTQLLMSEFYRLRKENPQLTKAAALQMAQQAMIEGKLQPLPEGEKRDAGKEMPGTKMNAPAYAYDPKKPYAHPYFWSPFILIGNWK